MWVMAERVRVRLDGDPPKEGMARLHVVPTLLRQGWVVVDDVEEKPESVDEDDEPELEIPHMDTEE
jgi:hypothetical protein